MSVNPDSPQPEVWMRGPVEGVPSLLQPVAHALLQAEEEVEKCLYGVADGWLWDSPSGKASIGFHLQHITGVIDRMLTYAKEQPLSESQFAYLRSEGKRDADITVLALLESFKKQVSVAIRQLRDTNENQLTAIRYLGRKRIPTTLIGLLFHAAEHTQRHVGQLLVTIAWVRSLR